MTLQPSTPSSTLVKLRHSDRHTDQLAHVAKGTLLVLTATCFGLGVNYFYSVLLARFLGATEFGYYALGLAAFNLLSVLSLGGLDSAAIKFIPAYSTQRNQTEVRLAAKTILTLSLVFGGITCLALLIEAGTVAEGLFHKPEMTPILMIFALGIPAFAISSVLIAILQASRDLNWRTTIKYICEPIAKIVLTVLLLWAGMTVKGAAVAFVAAFLLTILLALIPLRHLFIVRDSAQVSGTISYAKVLTFSMPLLWALLFASIAVRSDILLLGYWASASQVGVYSAAFQTSSIIALILGSFESISNPLFSQSIATGNQSQLERLYKTILRWSLTIAFPLFLAMELFPHDILSMFGKNFNSGALCLVILAVGQIVNSSIGSTNNVLLLAGHSSLVMWNSVIVGLIQIGLNLFLIPSYGIAGAAFATATGLVLVNIVRVTEGHFLLGLQPYQWGTWKPLAAGLGASVFIFILKSWSYTLSVPVLAIALVASYVSLVMLLGLDKDDQFLLVLFKEKVRSYKALDI